MNIQERNATLQEMKELKSEYCIGSLNAFKYLKARRWLENLIRQIHAENPTLTDNHGLTISTIAWLVLVTQSLFSRLLQITSVKTSTPESCSIQSEHIFTPLDLHPYGNAIEPDIRVWTVDYAAILKTFLTYLPSGVDSATTRRFLFNFLSNSFRAGRISIKLVQTEEEVSYTTFCDTPDYRGGGVHDAWIWADYLSSSGEKLITNKERLILKHAMHQQDLPTAHPILQRAEIKAILITPFVGMHDESGSTAPEDWLYDGNLYDRAEREYTLGHIHIQRGIVLSEVHKWNNGNNEFPSTDEFVDALISAQLERIQMSVNRMNRFRSMNAPSNVINREEQLLRKKRYIYTAIRQNRPWLVQFLSR